MIRVTRPGGVVGVQDQDFGTLALDSRLELTVAVSCIVAPSRSS